MQKRKQKAAKELGFSRNNPDDTQSHSDKQKRDNNSEDKVLSITNTSATRFTRFTTHARGLLYFINCHIHGHKTTSSTPRLCQFAAARQGGHL
jgi:predicted nucleic acid-binding Zn ribbon protein